MAVRGKLVEQDPADEPATELLKRIETEKRQLLTENEIKRQEPLPVVAADEMPFGVPSRWSVQRMGWLAKKLGAGSTPLGGKSVYQEEGVPFLRSQNVYDDGIRPEGVALIPRSIHEEMSGTHVQPQDILLNITGASIGRCALVPNGFREGNVSQHVAIIRLLLSDIREFVHLLPRRAFEFATTENKLILNVDKEKLKAAPGFNQDAKWPDFADRTWKNSIYNYYGYAPRSGRSGRLDNSGAR